MNPVEGNIYFLSPDNFCRLPANRTRPSFLNVLIHFPTQNETRKIWLQVLCWGESAPWFSKACNGGATPRCQLSKLILKWCETALTKVQFLDTIIQMFFPISFIKTARNASKSRFWTYFPKISLFDMRALILHITDYLWNLKLLFMYMLLNTFIIIFIEAPINLFQIWHAERYLRFII